MKGNGRLTRRIGFGFSVMLAILALVTWAGALQLGRGAATLAVHDPAGAALLFAARQRLVLLGAAGLVSGLFLLRLFATGVGKALNRVAHGLHQALAAIGDVSGEICTAGRYLATDAAEQAERLDSDLCDLREMTDALREHLSCLQTAESAAAGMADAARESRAAVTQLSTAIREIRRTAEESQHLLATVDDVARQTRLLSVNAAVEAARAGVAGAGFKVVAAEVGRLAIQSSEASQATASLAENSQQAAKEGEAVAEAAAEQIQASLAQVEALAVNLAELSRGCGEHVAGIERIAGDLIRLDELTHATADNAAAANGAQRGLTEEAAELGDMVRLLTTLVGDRAAHGLGPSDERWKKRSEGWGSAPAEDDWLGPGSFAPGVRRAEQTSQARSA